MLKLLRFWAQNIPTPNCVVSAEVDCPKINLNKKGDVIRKKGRIGLAGDEMFDGPITYT